MLLELFELPLSLPLFGIHLRGLVHVVGGVAARGHQVVLVLVHKHLLEQRVLKVEETNFQSQPQLLPLHIIKFDWHRPKLSILSGNRVKLSELVRGVVAAAP